MKKIISKVALCAFLSSSIAFCGDQMPKDMGTAPMQNNQKMLKVNTKHKHMGMQVVYLKIKATNCLLCAKAVTNQLEHMHEIAAAIVNFKKGTARIMFMKDMNLDDNMLKGLLQEYAISVVSIKRSK